MIEISIPGRGLLQCRHLVLDYNGTLAIDGRLIDGVEKHLQQLSQKVEIHVLTADTFGKAQAGLSGIDCTLSILSIDRQDVGKSRYVADLGASACVCIGNGRNDRLMLKRAALGIALIQAEGAAAETLLAADVVCSSIIAALELLSNPLRLVATLRI